ncbi:MAG: hypothetical protein OXC28_07220 [Defluviicoccus sp.]|nr:hypothetical protein [Defluviicoccus sp.]
MVDRIVGEAMLPSVRWAIIRTIHVGGHMGATEIMIREVVAAEFLGVTTNFVRDQLDYLQKRKLVEIERSEIHPWRATLTRYGYDVAEYQVDCEAGIRRPPRVEG